MKIEEGSRGRVKLYEPEVAYCLAIFDALRNAGISQQTAQTWLKNWYGFWKKHATSKHKGFAPTDERALIPSIVFVPGSSKATNTAGTTTQKSIREALKHIGYPDAEAYVVIDAPHIIERCDRLLTG